MDELTLPVTYRHKDYDFPIRIVQQGYVYRFLVTIDTVELIFERDDSGAFRAVLPDQGAQPAGRLPEYGLIEAIAQVLEQL